MRAMTGRLDGALWLKLAGVLGVIAFADWLFFSSEQSGGAIGFVGLAIVAALALTRPAVRQDRRALLALALAALAATAFVIDPSPLAFLLFWLAIGVATLMPGTAAFDDGWRWFQRLLVHGFKSLFGPLIDALRLNRVRHRRPVQSAGLRLAAKTLVLPLAGSAVILALFAMANPVIEGWLDGLSLPSMDEETFVRLIVAGFLAWLTWGVLRPRPPRFLLGTIDGRGDKAIPGVSLASVLLSLVMFNALFAMQNLMDSAFLWGGVKLPGSMTLAQYAHRGAYPLVVTALLAAAFVLVALRPGSQTAAHPWVRRLVMLWIGQNLFLVGSAMLRTWDYVKSYDLTVLRIAALLWMVLVAAGLVLVLWRMLREKSGAWLINANLATSGTLLFAVCFVDLGAIAANWNVRHAREIDGTGAALDLCYLNELGESALVPLARLELQQGNSRLGRDAAALRSRLLQRMEADRDMGEWSLRANRRIAEARALLGPKADQPVDDAEPCYRGYPVPVPAEPATAPAAAAPATPITVPAAPKLTGPKEQ
ncbi:MAG: DUF4173 domain-containing protein [Sphingomonadales bacterium]|nr:DUF4173 domain-containing protein [Sphingomonadales bacterium]